MSRKKIAIIAVAILAIVVAAWVLLKKPDVPEGFAASNGRLEATDYYISSKRAGRIADVLVNEGYVRD